MCRWLAYSGRPIFMDALLFQPHNSLIHQSLLARHAAVATNGDGFGLGWYGNRPQPGLFRDVRPAWNDENLRSLSEQIEARLFFAHVRASTGPQTARSNCHPFRYKHWLFMHNGKIGDYARVRRSLEFALDESLYDCRLGTTDSELLFLLAVQEGLEQDPVGALARALGRVEQEMARVGAEEPLRLTAALSDGQQLIAFRYSSDGQSPSLFHAEGAAVTVQDGCCHFAQGGGSVLVLSEPLDTVEGCWHAVPEGQVLTVEQGAVSLAAFGPQPPQALAA